MLSQTRWSLPPSSFLLLTMHFSFPFHHAGPPEILISHGGGDGSKAASCVAVGDGVGVCESEGASGMARTGEKLARDVDNDNQGLVLTDFVDA